MEFIIYGSGVDGNESTKLEVREAFIGGGDRGDKFPKSGGRESFN